MKHQLHPHRPAMAALFALVASSTAPVFAQDVTIVSPPPPVINAPPPTTSASPPPAIVAPPAVSVVPAPVARPLPPTPVARTAPAPAPARQTARSVRTTRAVTRTARAAPVRAPAPPVEAAPAPAPAPVQAAPPAPVAPPAAQPAAVPVAEQPASALQRYWPWLAAAGVLLIAALAMLVLRRRRTAYEEAYYEEPVYEAEPGFAAAPVAAADADEASVAEPDRADMAALAAASEPEANRPWLEFLMRPVRAGTNQDEAVVTFELTVGNTGTVEARDVRISTWMVAGGQGTEMERSLIDPPADAHVSEVDISAGDGARVEAELAVPKGGLSEPVLPVVVADARYSLPDGSEGRTHASFAIGRAGDGEIEPFALDRTGITENVEARLHGEPERV